MPSHKSPLLLPPTAVPEVGKPQQAAVVVQTEDGKKLMFPQVAVAMVSPEVIEMLAEAVYRRLNNVDILYDNPAPTEAPVESDPTL